jgi:hypothetical protein
MIAVYMFNNTKSKTMKKFILSLSIAAIFAACSNPQSAETLQANKLVPDTAGLAAFNHWKEQQSAFSMEGVSEQATEQVQQTEVVAAQPKQVIVYREAPVRRVAPIRQQAIAKAPTRVSNTGVREATSRDDSSPSKTSTSTPADNGSTAGTGTGVGTSETGTTGDVATAPAEKKEGWSKAAKGTAVGGASGAVVGAVISKNKTTGAVIGGVVGAAGGYILGRKQDKKDGRY